MFIQTKPRPDPATLKIPAPVNVAGNGPTLPIFPEPPKQPKRIALGHASCSPFEGVTAACFLMALIS